MEVRRIARQAKGEEEETVFSFRSSRQKFGLTNCRGGTDRLTLL